MQLQTRWYYERARGQYLDEKGREGTTARKNAFEITNPKRQKFTKTDLAKFENTWNQLPYIVSRGAEKNFNEFMVILKERGEFQPDRTYFEHLIAKAILFRQTEKLIQKQQYGGYRANIVTYTLALISHKTAQRIDLDRIWKEQSISHVLMDTIIKVSEAVHRHITNPPGGRNITEWCKKEQCWKDLIALDIDIQGELENELIQTDGREKARVDRGIESPDNEDREKISEVMKVSAETWFRLAQWAKETGNLQPWQRSLSYSMGKLANRRKEPSRKQAFQALKILADVSRMGFEIDHQNTENSSEKESSVLDFTESSKDIKIVEKEKTFIKSENENKKFLREEKEKSNQSYENIKFLEKLTEIIKSNPYITRTQLVEKFGCSLTKVKMGVEILEDNNVIQHRLVIGKKNKSLYQYFILDTSSP